MISAIGYYLMYGVFSVLALLPLRVLYVMSDFLYVLIFGVIGYRKKVVLDNLANCFPEKTLSERYEIASDFYRNFADNIVETIKLLHISDAQMSRRMLFVDNGIIDELTAKGKDVAVYFSHCGNWEWAPSITLHNSHEGVEYCQVYRPLKNKAFDRLMLKIRNRFGSTSFPKSTVLKDLIMLRRENMMSVTGFMSDQKPSHGDPTVKTIFLNRPTAFISGTETLVKRLGLACVYWDMEKLSRGHYRITCRLMNDGTELGEFGDITRRYAELLETTIRRNPAIWLWTHKRWKYPVTLD